MNKYIILALIIGLFMGSGVALAASKRLWAYDSKRLEAGFVQQIYGPVIDSYRLRVVKFNDEGNLCYVVFSEVQSNTAYTPSLQCAFK